jgi:hypothetical protein
MTPVKGSRFEILLFARSSAEQSSAANMLWSVFGLRFYDVGQGTVSTCRLAFELRRDGGSSTQICTWNECSVPSARHGCSSRLPRSGEAIPSRSTAGTRH